MADERKRFEPDWNVYDQIRRHADLRDEDEETTTFRKETDEESEQ